jgi:hypothetical protein
MLFSLSVCNSTSAQQPGQADPLAICDDCREQASLERGGCFPYHSPRLFGGAFRDFAEKPHDGLAAGLVVLDYEIGRCTRKCAQTGEDFKPGQPFYSALMQDGAEITRRDFSEAAWQGPPENCIGSWKSVMPDPNAKKVAWAPQDVILDFFIELEHQPDKLDTRFVLALLMVRRHVLRLEDTETVGSHEQMVLYCPRNETEYRVLVSQPAPERISQIQIELELLLFSAVE